MAHTGEASLAFLVLSRNPVPLSYASRRNGVRDLVSGINPSLRMVTLHCRCISSSRLFKDCSMAPMPIYPAKVVSMKSSLRWTGAIALAASLLVGCTNQSASSLRPLSDPSITWMKSEQACTELTGVPTVPIKKKCLALRLTRSPT